MNHRFVKQWLLITLFISGGVLTGCSKSGVTGTVRKDGQPVAAGQIRFRSVKDPSKEFATDIAKGQFRVESPDLTGECTVEIDVFFVNSAEAANFYRDMSLEINHDKVLHGDPGNESQDEIRNEENVPTNPKKHGQLRRPTVLQDTFSAGMNVRNYDVNLE